MLPVPESFTRSFVYLDCGARGEEAHPFVSAFPGAQYLGFEADKDECERLQARAKSGYTFFPVAVGRKNEELSFHITRNPACSSFLKPNFDFLSQYVGLAENFEIQKTIPMKTASLDEYLPSAGIDNVDFIELDTQGTELEILKGGEAFLRGATLGLKVEAEFCQFYEEQPLFGDLDAFARDCGFLLFDLSRYRYRRQGTPLSIRTRGQVVYGHAVYLKDYRLLPEDAKFEKGIKLCMIADYYGFLDYACEIALHLKGRAATVTEGESQVLAHILAYYEKKARERNRTQRIMALAEKLGMEKLLDRVIQFFHKVSLMHLEARRLGRPLWVD